MSNAPAARLGDERCEDLSVVAGDDVDFDSCVPRQPGRLDRRSGRVGLGEKLRVRRVHGGEILHVRQKDRRPDDRVVGEAGRLEQRADVLQHSAGLGGDVAVDELAGGRVERHLSRQE